MRIAVIGGGAAGCSAAYTLSKLGHEVDLFESSPTIGGRTKQVERDGFSIPSGALFVMQGIYPRVSGMLRDMGHDGELTPWAGDTQLLDQNDKRYAVNLVKMPSYLSLPVLSFGDKVKLALTGARLFLTKGPKNPFDGGQLVPFDKGENMEDWSRRNLGNRGHDYIIDPIMNFLTAAPARDLATAFPLAMIKNALSMRLTVPPEGMGQISKWLMADSPNARIHLSSPVDNVAPANQGFLLSGNGETT